MKLTKYEHACVVIEKQGVRLVIDPGTFSSTLPVLTDVKAIVVTHQHADHLDSERLQQLRAANPDTPVFTADDVAQAHPELGLSTVEPGQSLTVGPFALTFTGGQHAEIDSSLPRIQNIGVLINDGAVYYPGDSFAEPGNTVQTLLVPAAAPWMKVSEAMDFLRDVQPELAIPTHDAILSEQGKQIYDNMLGSAGVRYQRLQTGESIGV